MQVATKQGRSDDRSRRKDSSRVLKRKKRMHAPYLSVDEIARVFKPCKVSLAPNKLLSSPSIFLRQMKRTFDTEFPGYMPGRDLLAVITADLGQSDSTLATAR